MTAGSPFASPDRYRALVAAETGRVLRSGLPAGPPAQAGLAAATLTVGVELMAKLAGGARAGAALLRLAHLVERHRLQEFHP